MQQFMNYQQPYMQNLYSHCNQQRGYSIIPVTNSQEAYVAQVDIINGTPSFFYNQGANEIYMKQSLPNGSANFIKFTKQNDELLNENKSVDINSYKKDLKALNDKIDGLYALFENKEENVKGNSKNVK